MELREQVNTYYCDTLPKIQGCVMTDPNNVERVKDYETDMKWARMETDTIEIPSYINYFEIAKQGLYIAKILKIFSNNLFKN